MRFSSIFSVRWAWTRTKAFFNFSSIVSAQLSGSVKSCSVLHLWSFLIPPIFLISYSDFILTSYPFSDFLILCSVSIHPWFTIPSNPSCSSLMMLSNTSCSCIMCQLSPISLQTSQNFCIQKMFQKILRICPILPPFFDPKNSMKIWNLFKISHVKKY